jgi:hypothetical protein
MNPSRILLAAVITLLLNGCSTAKIAKIGIECETSTKDYIRLVRWNEFENAMVTYVSAPLQGEYRRKIEAAGEVKVVDYRVKTRECDPVKGEASVKVEVDYYIPPSVTVKTVIDYQKWTYEGPEDQRVWRLKTSLPDFK